MSIETRPVSPLKQARQDAGLRLVDVCVKADISVGYLSMIESGYVPPRGIQDRIAAALKCPASRFWEPA